MMSSQPQNIEYTRDSSGEYHITFEPYDGRVTAMFNAKAVAESTNAMLLREGRYPPVIYFPREDVRMDLLIPTEHHTYCPFRGNSAYFDLEVGDRRAENIAWSYEEPYQDSYYIKNYIAFYRDVLDDWIEASIPSSEPGVEPATQNPLVDWLVREAWQAGTISDLVTRWITALEDAAIPVLRFALITRTLHPQLSGASYRWQKGVDAVDENWIGHEVLESSQYLSSPLFPIFKGAGGVRRRLDSDPETDDYPILEEIRNAGGTDYVAMPLVFSDGQINAITISTDQAGGFTTTHLGFVDEVLPLFGRLVEVFLQREKSVTLLQTYLGGQTGRRVLEGLVRRGDGEEIHAVIWFCDLRGSSTLAASMSREKFLAQLNRFFDCMGGAVLDHGGEVLRFIGDAALAIFPLDEATGQRSVCDRALAAARDACGRVRAFNLENQDTGDAEMAFGIGLHIGDVTWGNIGTGSRLEFTVIGAAANEAARIESLCKTLRSSVLVSENFVSLCPGDYESLGKHALRGTERVMEVFAPAWQQDCAGETATPGEPSVNNRTNR